MAGSLRPFIYESDDGKEYSIVRDESNTEILNAAGQGTSSTPNSSTPNLPRGYEPRYALLYQKDDPRVKRKVVVLNSAIFQDLNGGTDYSLQVVGSSNKNFRISSLIGERRTSLTVGDTGQNDGDSEGGIVQQ